MRRVKGYGKEMYRLVPKKVIFLAIAWLILGFWFVMQWFGHALQSEIRVGLVPTIAWLAVNGILLTPAWRIVWRRIPYLQAWFPDLNGDWDVELCSNWPRQQQLIDAASARGGTDVLGLPESQLAPIEPLKMHAEIRQGWWKFEIRFTNPTGDSPIDRSDTFIVEPFAGDGQAPPGISYFFEQRNDTANLADDTKFYGAARLEFNGNKQQLQGCFWTNRQWRRAINTAGSLIMTRRSSDVHG